MLQMRLWILTFTLTLSLDVVVMATVNGKAFANVLDDLARDSLGLQEIQVPSRIPTVSITHTHTTLWFSHKHLIRLE